MELKERVETQIKKYFKIGYYDTEANRAVKDAFLLFCQQESDGHYLLGIKKLLESYSTDWKFDSLYDELQRLKEEVEEFKKTPVKDVSKEIKTFGRGEKK